MKVLVSTAETQGQRENDFCYVPEGEIVMLGFICDRDVNDPDGECSCNRCLIGTKCLKGTTTFKVISRKRKDRSEAPKCLLGVAKNYSEGSVLEYRVGVFTRRK